MLRLFIVKLEKEGQVKIIIKRIRRSLKLFMVLMLYIRPTRSLTKTLKKEQKASGRDEGE